MAFSYSFHMSAKGHSVNTVEKLKQVSKHNLRSYKSSDYDREKIVALQGGTDSVLKNVEEIYQREFSEALERYNTGRRADRQIHDYLKHVSDSRSDVACEIIIQVGDKDFWSEKTLEEKKQMNYIFSDQLRSLEKLVPEFKVASAVVHYDEASPHMHVVGVPVADGYKKGLEKQVAKTKVFTADRLSYLQDRMRENAEKGMELEQNHNLFANVTLMEKQKGRNKDIPKHSLAEFEKLQREIVEGEKRRENLSIAINALEFEKANLKDENWDLSVENDTLFDQTVQLSAQKDQLDADLKKLEERKTELMSKDEVERTAVAKKTFFGKEKEVVEVETDTYVRLRNTALRVDEVERTLRMAKKQREEADKVLKKAEKTRSDSERMKQSIEESRRNADEYRAEVERELRYKESVLRKREENVKEQIEKVNQIGSALAEVAYEFFGREDAEDYLNEVGRRSPYKSPEKIKRQKEREWDMER